MIEAYSGLKATEKINVRYLREYVPMSWYNDLKISKKLMTASDAQASNIEQLNAGLMLILQVVQTTAAASEERAAAGVELSGQAATRKDTISVFKIKRGLSSGQQAHLCNNISHRNAAGA